MNFHNHLNQIVETLIFIPICMHGCPLRLRPYLKGEGKSKKSESWKTTSFGCSIMGNQHCNGQCIHLGSGASFAQNQRLAYKLVDRFETSTKVQKFTTFFMMTCAIRSTKGQVMLVYFKLNQMNVLNSSSV